MVESLKSQPGARKPYLLDSYRCPVGIGWHIGHNYKLQWISLCIGEHKRRSRGTIPSYTITAKPRIIRRARVAPMTDALLEHWIRVDIDPMAATSIKSFKI